MKISDLPNRVMEPESFFKSFMSSIVFIRFHCSGLVWILLFGIVAGGFLMGRPANGQAPVTGTVVSCTDGRADRYSCENVNLESYLPIDRLGGERGVRLNDIWGWTDPQTGIEYALVGRTNGVAFVDLSTPTEPVYLGELPTHSGGSSWRDVKVYDNHAYVVSEASGHGLQVFDLTQLRSVSDPPTTFSETTHYDRFQTAHNVVVNRESGYAYAVGITSSQSTPPSADCGAGLHIIDVRTPDQPQFAGCHNDLNTGGQVAAGYTHDAQCVVYRGPDADYQGQEICFNANESQINIADVTDKEAPTTIANATYPRPGYVHQAWLTDDQRYLLVDDETDENEPVNGIDSTRTLVLDVSDLDNPELVTSYSGPTPSSDHNQYVVGPYTYQANYRSGLRILDVTDPEVPVEVGHFDTHPSSDDSGFEGAWSTYPFFESGTIVVSSIGEGLFVLSPSRFPAILSLTGRRTEQNTARLQWTVSRGAQTDFLEIERTRPGQQSWRRATTRDEPLAGDGRRQEVEVDELQPGEHRFRLRHVSQDGTVSVSDPVSVRILPGEDIRLTGLPNPIQGRQQFTLLLRETQEVRVGLYDVLGRRVATLYEGEIVAGTRQEVTIAPPSSGMYVLRVLGTSVRLSRKVAVTR